jgi:hypothetical protein
MIVMESNTFWGITKCNPLNVNRLHPVTSQKIILVKKKRKK